MEEIYYEANVSRPDTCSRWRQKYPEFAERFVEASRKQLWGSADALAKYHHYCPYKQRVGVYLPARQKPRSEALRGLQGYFTGGLDSNSDDDFICEVF